MDFIFEPWPWYIGGPLIGLMVPILLYFGNKQFGISTSMRDFCATCIQPNDFFRIDLKSRRWSFAFVGGVITGGIIAAYWMSSGSPVEITSGTKEHLQEIGVSQFNTLIPQDIFSWENLLSAQGMILMVLGGFLVGFGTRWANGCTSGHAIMGLSLLNPASLIAVIGFFIGGLLSTYFILPHILSL